MIEYYPGIRLVHIIAVIASGLWFLARGTGYFYGARWPLSGAARLLAYTIDTILLTAAMMLTSIIRQYPFVHAWLTVKVVLLVVYVALGIFAFWNGPTRGFRIGCWFAAMAVYLFIISVAITHDPLGLIDRLIGH